MTTSQSIGEIMGDCCKAICGKLDETNAWLKVVCDLLATIEKEKKEKPL